MRKVLLVIFCFLFASPLSAQILLAESFEATTFPPAGWTAATGGTGSTRAAWTRIANGANPTNTPHSGVAQAKLNGYDAQNGTATLITPSLNFSYSSGFIQVAIWIYRESSYPEPKYATEGVTVSVNTTASPSGATSLGFIPRNRANAPTEASNGWYRYTFTVPSTFNGTVNHVIISGTSCYGSNFYIDDLEVSHLTPCSGTPFAGNAFASVDSLCAGIPFVLNDTNISLSGVTYQWQSSPAGSGSWTNIAGATTIPYTLSAGITTPTDFRVLVTCTGSSATGISSTVRVGTKVFLNCYCVSGSNFATDNIGQVTIGPNFANPSIAPLPLINNPGAVAKYTDYTNLAPANIVPGGAMPFTVTQFNTGGYWGCGLAVYADVNHNGSFGDPGELVYGPTAGTATASSPTWSGTLAIPATALPGLTRMRFVLVERTLSISPCSVFGWGETEDYLVNVISAMPPDPVLGSVSPVCEHDPIVINATIPSYYPAPVYTLTGPSIGAMTSTSGTFTIPAAICANSGTYSVRVSSQNLTSGAATVAVLVNCVPTIAVSGGTAPSGCLVTDGSFRVSGLSPAAAYTLHYRNAGNASKVSLQVAADASGTYLVGGLAVGSYDSVYVTTGAGCRSNIITQSVVIPTPTPPAAPNVIVMPYPICEGTTVTLSIANAVSDGTYSWTGPNGFTDTGRSVLVPGFSTLNAGLYTAILTVAGCASAPSNASLNMLQAAPRPVRNNISYCQFDTGVVPMTAQTLPGYFVEWFDTCSGGPGCTGGLRSRGSTMASPNPPTPNTNVPGIVMWLVRQSAPNGCPSGFDSVYVRVLPRPLAPAVSTTVAYCQYEVIGPLTASGVNLRWFGTPTGGTGSPTAPTPSTLIPGTYHFYVSQTSVEGCESQRSQITVVIKPKPEPPAVTSPVNLCQGDPPQQLNAIGRDLLWYTGPNGGVGVGVAPVINTSYEDSFFYYVTQTVNGCESDRALIGTYIRYKPNGVITASSQSVCQDGYDTFYYYGNGRPDAEYHWFAPLSSRFISGENTPGPVVIHFDTAGTSVVQLIVNNKGCISKLLAAPITVRPLPVISFVNRQDACEDELITVSLRSIEPNISAYQWDFGPEATIVYGEVRTGGPFGIRYPRAGHYTVSASATKAGCTSKPTLQDIFVHPRPDATISYDYKNGRPLDQFCSQDTLHLTVQAVPEGATYKWTPGAFFQSKLDSLNTEVDAVVSRSSFVHVVVRDAFGCEAADSLLVPAKPCCGIYFPNAFTPSSQIEQNRIFRPISSGTNRINNFRVMNRWGQVVFESTQPGSGWDGTYRGVPQDMGTYYFYINYRCGDKNIEDQGELVLVR